MTFTTALILLSQITAMTIPSALQKKFKKNTPFYYATISLVFSLLFFVVVFLIKNGLDFSGFEVNLLKYALPFGACFSASSIFTKLALDEGDLSLTSLFLSFSLLIPTMYGVIFLGDPIDFIFWIALVLFLISLVVVNVDFSKTAKRKPVTLKWVIFLVCGSITNGLCSTIQTAQQNAYNGLKGDESMIISLTLAIVIATIVIFVAKEKPFIKDATKSALALGAPSGTLIGLNNLLVMVLVGQKLLPVSILFPLISGGGLILSFLLGRFIFKEKYKLQQYFGILCGFASIILFNI